MNALAMKIHGSILIVLTLMSSIAAATQEDDLVTNLPGLPALNSKIFSGYVTVDDKHGRTLFYFFAEAQNNSQIKPLTLWLNGGPGCSSLGIGAFAENGPFIMERENPVINPNSWNYESNMLYLESPAGVGFSYSNTTSDYNDADDEKTALDSFTFLQRWVQKFPQYKDRDFYIAGESYAGHYIPQLASLLVKNKKTSALQLKGIMMGNPTIDIEVDVGPAASAFFLWTHGQISDETYAAFLKECEGEMNDENDVTCSYTSVLSFNNETGPINYYNVLSDICMDTWVAQQTRLLRTLKLQNFVARSATRPAKFGVRDPCDVDTTVPYFNRKDVRAALHARPANESRSWNICAYDLKYNGTHDQMQPLLKYVMENNVKVWVMSGDQDSIVPLTTTRKIINDFAKGSGWNITSPYKPWWADKQIAGWTVQYNTNLLYATVKAAGHLVPRDQPRRGFQFFKSFLEGTNLPLEI